MKREGCLRARMARKSSKQRRATGDEHVTHDFGERFFGRTYSLHKLSED